MLEFKKKDGQNWVVEKAGTTLFHFELASGKTEFELRQTLLLNQLGADRQGLIIKEKKNSIVLPPSL